MTYFAVCPKCENPVQFINIVAASSTAHRRYAKHENRRVDGFEFFDGHALRTCPLMRRNQNPQKTDRRPMSETSRRIIQLAVENFDRIVNILQSEFGVRFSNRLAGEMINAWFKAEAYNYTGANLENIPWMIAYFAPTMNVYRQYFMPGSELAVAIRRNVPHAILPEGGQLTSSIPFLKLGLSTLKHRIQITADEDVTESFVINVLDLSGTDDPVGAPIVYKRQMLVDPSKFEGAIKSRRKRNEPLIALAREAAAGYGFIV